MLKLKAGLLLIGLFASAAQAATLTLKIFEDDAVGSDIVARTDGIEARSDASGRLVLNIGAGEKTVELFRDGASVLQFVVEARSEQDAIVGSIHLHAAGDPQVNIQYSDVAEGRLTGSVFSMETGAGVADVVVFVEGSEVSTTTDFDGVFSLTLPPGSYALSLSHPNYGTRSVDATVDAGVQKEVRYQLSMDAANGPVEEVLAVATYVPQTAAVQERSSSAVLDVIDSEQISRLGDGTAAAALKRVSGLTIQDGKYAVIRGLQGRYNSTTLNRATLPSTDPTRRVVPLDLFPSGVIDTVNVQKTFSPDVPGDSTGGAIDLRSRHYPEEGKTKVSVSLGWNSETTGENVVHQQDDTDILGRDADNRELPANVAANTADGQLPVSGSDAQIEALGESFPANLAVVDEKARPNIGFEIVTGGNKPLDENEFGYLFGVKYKNSWSAVEGQENEFQPDAVLTSLNEYSYEQATNEIDLSLNLALGYALGYNHTFAFNTMLLRQTDASTKVKDGYDFEAGNFASRKVTHEWIEREILINQFLGSHTLDSFHDSIIEWRITASGAEYLAPDRRFFEYLAAQPDEILRLVGSSFERRWDEMTDDNIDFGTDYTLPLGDVGPVDAEIKAGIAVFEREREAATTRFGYAWQGLPADELVASANQNPDGVISPANISANGYVLRNETQTGGGSSYIDSYDATWDLFAWYLMTKLDYQGKVEATVGVRIEDSEQVVTTDAQDALLDEQDVLPALNVTWFVNTDMQIRFGYSSTVSRPDFTELAPSTIIDPLFDFPVVGNPFLKRTEIDNFDIRGEWYRSATESFSVAYFFKDLVNPIEQTIQPASGSASDARTFENALTGEISGIEIEGRREFYLDEAEAHGIFVQGNLALIDSEVDLGPTTPETRQKRELQGQAEYILNLIVGYDHFNSGQKVTLAFNQAGERIELADKGGKPPVIEEPFADVKLSYEKTFINGPTINAEIGNLLNAEVEYTQGPKVFKDYKPGRDFEIGLTWEF